LKLAAFIFTLISFFAPMSWGQTQPDVTGGTANMFGDPFPYGRTAYCPEGSYGIGLRSLSTSTNLLPGKFCIGCLTNLRLLCNPLVATRGLSENISPFVIMDMKIGYKGSVSNNPDVTCPAGFYLSGIHGWGAGPQAGSCTTCVSNIKISCTSFGPIPLSVEFDMSSPFEGKQIPFLRASYCDGESYVAGIQAWVAPQSTKNCVGCLTGAQVFCQKFEKK
jgi:hypothetical protein